jgi:hypothetical protein
MAHPMHHAARSAARFGGRDEDYQAIHDWFDASKGHMPDLRHRALRHHSEGIFLCEAVFGVAITNSNGKRVPVRQIAEQHVMDDLGWIPSVKDWLQHIDVQPWMTRSPWKPSEERAEDVAVKASKERG